MTSRSTERARLTIEPDFTSGGYTLHGAADIFDLDHLRLNTAAIEAALARRRIGDEELNTAASETAFEAMRAVPDPRIALGDCFEDWDQDRRERLHDAATEAYAQAGADIDDPDVQDRIAEEVEDFVALADVADRALSSDFSLDHREEQDAYDAVYGVWTPAVDHRQELRSNRCADRGVRVRMRGRSRAPRRGAHRQQGSRRTAATTGARGDPHLDEPPGDSWLPIGGRR